MQYLLFLIHAHLPVRFTTKQFDQVIKTRTHHLHTKHLLNRLVLKGHVKRHGGDIYSLKK